MIKNINYLLNDKAEINNHLDKINYSLNKLSAEKRIDWSIDNLPQEFALSSSFGIQSIISLHLITSKIPSIPIILIDTGYMFPETYNFIDMIKKKLNLNLNIFRSKKSPAWQEAKYGKLWEQGLKGINKYNYINKVIPMKKALKKLNVKTWFAGLRKDQSQTRKKLNFLSIQKNTFKFLPILDWNDKKAYDYIKNNKLDLHPLWNKGYLSIGDVHTTHKWNNKMKKEEARFFGLKRECGIHE